MFHPARVASLPVAYRRNVVFFSSLRDSASESSWSQTRALERGRARRRNKWAALAVAVALVGSSAVVVSVYTQPAAAQQQPAASPSDQLQEGIKQYKGGDYEAAVATLEGISPDALSASGQSMLKDTLGRARSASSQRQGAIAEFDAGEKALAAGDAADAARHYRAAYSSPYADKGTKQKAAEQLALAQSMMEAKQGDLK